MARDLLYSSIQRFSTDDGPGIRTTVFLMGCPLACKWCHNPENLSMRPLLQFRSERCLSCGACAAACSRGVHRFDAGQHCIERRRCSGCGACVKACPAGALSLLGTRARPEELVDVIVRDADFYRASGGGATFSGGEPLLQADGVAQAMRLCHAASVATAVETAGDVPWEAFEAVLPHADLFLYDVKCVSENLHRQWTGRSNARVLANFERLAAACAQRGTRLCARTPLVRPFNVDEDELSRIARFLAPFFRGRPGGQRAPMTFQFLPYHSLGYGKYQMSGVQWTPCEAPSEEQSHRACQLFRSLDVPATIG